MKRHKGMRIEPTDHPDLSKIILVMRKPKKKNRIRRIMCNAYEIKWDDYIIKKYKKYE